jgi:tetratricopeptide (TPR) repeat protein
MEEVANPSYYSLTLKSSEEARLEQVFSSHCDASKKMNLYNFIILAIEKKIVSNSCPLNKIAELFMQAAGDKSDLNYSRFFFAVTLLARVLFSDEISPVEQMLTQILVDQMAGSNQSNLPRQDALTQLLFSEPVIRKLEIYDQACFQILQIYNSQNIQNRKKTVGIKQITSKNIGISARNFLRFCRNSNIIPHLLNIESFQDCVNSVCPPQNKDEQNFYENSLLIKFYETDNNFFELSRLEPIDGEPELRLHHIQLALGRIALDCIKDLIEPEQKIEIFFDQKLELTPEAKFGPGCDVSYGEEDISDKSFSSLEEHDQIIADYNHKQIVSQKGIRDDIDLLDVIKVTPAIPNVEDIIKMLDDDRAPSIPPKVQVVPQNPPPYNLPPVLFKLPEPPSDKNDKSVPQRQNKSGKKEETAADRLKFRPLPGSFLEGLPKTTKSETVLAFKKNMNSNLFPETAKKSLCNPGISPCLIKEIYLPPSSPTEISTLIESVIVLQNNYNFSMALISLDKAKNKWLEIMKTDSLKPEIELYFEMTRGAIYESCEKDALALAQYYTTKIISDRLAFNHPDKALVYCGLGSVLYHSGEAEVALRCFLMGKKIRERTIGGDTIDTATVYNNIAVCLNGLQRFQEAYVYLELSAAIMDEILGPNHTRTLTVKQNIERIKRESMLASPEYQVLWSKQLVDPYPKPKKKGKKKGKKSKK